MNCQWYIPKDERWMVYCNCEFCVECDNCGFWFEKISNESICESCRDYLEYGDEE